MTPIRLLLLVLLLGLTACQTAGNAPPVVDRSPPARPQEPDGGLGGTGNAECPVALPGVKPVTPCR